MDRTKIEWTDATWNVIQGCQKVSPGCAHCYAETLVNGRLRGDFATLKVNDARLDQPLRWRRPRRIFVNSLSDLFWDQVPDQVVDDHFAVMALARQHTFQVLTKRPDRMRAYLTNPQTEARIVLAAIKFAAKPGLTLSMDWPLGNVHLGTSTENQPMFDKRIDDLLATPAAVRFLSVEPMLGPIEVRKRQACGDCDPCIGGRPDQCAAGPYWLDPLGDGIDWVICGGESGPKARPMHPDWARRLRDQCGLAGVPFLFKQWGEWAPANQVPEAEFNRRQDQPLKVQTWPDDVTVSLRFGKRAAGRLLDGRTWDLYPKGER